jgi:hypothetical protein
MHARDVQRTLYPKVYNILRINVLRRYLNQINMMQWFRRIYYVGTIYFSWKSCGQMVLRLQTTDWRLEYYNILHETLIRSRLT